MTEILTPTGNMVWKAQDFQVPAFACPNVVKELLLTGTRGSGKSDIALLGFARNVGKGWGPNLRYYCFKRTIPECEPIFEKAKILFQQIWPDVKYVTHPYKVFRFRDGEMLTIRQMYDLEDYNSLHGAEVGGCIFDELSIWPTSEVYMRCLSLLRSSHSEVSKQLRCWSTTNPSGPGRGWVMKRWRLNDPTNNCKFIYDNVADNPDLQKYKGDKFLQVQSRPRMSIFLYTLKNKIFMDANPTYLSDLAAEAPNDSIRQAWVNGDWLASAGGGYWDDIWEDRYHVVKPFKIPYSWKIDRALDWGNASPFCVLWFAQSDGSDYQDKEGKWHSTVPGDIFVIYEWYGTNGKPNQGLGLPANEVARGIVERQMEWGIHDRTLAGPADNQLDTELNAGWNMMESMSESIRLRDGTVVPGVQWRASDKAAGARITGWNMIRTLLKNVVPDPNHPYPREKPGLFFFRNLEHCLQHFPNTPRDEKKPEDVPNRGEYHIQDVVRYRVLDEGRPMSQGSTVGKY
jgi:hypothetical protein